MKTYNIITAIGIILLVIFLSGCIQKITKDRIQTAPKVDYSIISKIDYDKHLCGSTSFHHKPKGFNTGLRVVLKDKNTGASLEGYATISVDGGGGSLSSGKDYSCEEQVSSGKAIVSVFSKGYTPAVFELDLPKNQLATIEVSMMKSCSGGPSCFDNMLVGLLESAGGNKKKAEEIILSSKNRFFDIIQESFGLKKSDYELSCVECDMGRGGYIKAKGIYKDGSPLELYYHWGWCSSGGDDCGWDVCFSSTSDAIFKSVKTNFCSKLSSKQNNDGYICTDVEYDNTRRVKNKCFAGEYEKITGNKKTLAIKQISNRCKSSVDKGNFDCMKN